MSSYYKTINGKKYDKAMLDIADKSVDKGDGKISLTDAKAIMVKAKDGGKITDVELRTLNYILEKYHFTEPALKYIEDNLSDNVVSKDKEISDHEKPVHTQTKESHKENKPVVQKKESKSNKIKYILIFLLLLLLLLAFLLFNFVCKKEPVLTDKNDGITPVLNNKEKKDTANDENSKNNIKSDNKNEYVVKPYDTLVKISEEVYGDYRSWKDIYKANNDKIKNPIIIYPGQVLKIPEKNK